MTSDDSDSNAPVPRVERRSVGVVAAIVPDWRSRSRDAADQATRQVDQLNRFTEAASKANGTLAKTMLDGTIYTFPTPGEALKGAHHLREAARAYDHAHKQQTDVEIGVTTGDIAIVDGGVAGAPVIDACHIAEYGLGDDIAISRAVRDGGGSATADVRHDAKVVFSRLPYPVFRQPVPQRFNVVPLRRPTDSDPPTKPVQAQPSVEVRRVALLSTRVSDPTFRVGSLRLEDAVRAEHDRQQVGRAIEDAGGRKVRETLGGAIYAFDDAARAVDAAVAAQQTVAAQNVERDDAVELRTGVHVGEAAFNDEIGVAGGTVQQTSDVAGLTDPGSIAFTEAVAAEAELPLDYDDRSRRLYRSDPTSPIVHRKRVAPDTIDDPPAPDGPEGPDDDGPDGPEDGPGDGPDGPEDNGPGGGDGEDPAPPAPSGDGLAKVIPLPRPPVEPDPPEPPAADREEDEPSKPAPPDEPPRPVPEIEPKMPQRPFKPLTHEPPEPEDGPPPADSAALEEPPAPEPPAAAGALALLCAAANEDDRRRLPRPESFEPPEPAEPDAEPAPSTAVDEPEAPVAPAPPPPDPNRFGLDV